MIEKLLLAVMLTASFAASAYTTQDEQNLRYALIRGAEDGNAAMANAEYADGVLTFNMYMKYPYTTITQMARSMGSTVDDVNNVIRADLSKGIHAGSALEDILDRGFTIRYAIHYTDGVINNFDIDSGTRA